MQSLFDLLSSRDHRTYYYLSTTLHQAWNYLNGVKLYPDFLDFLPSADIPGSASADQTRELTTVGRLVRRKGSYHAAVRKAQRDLIRGHGFVQKGWVMGSDGLPSHIKYEHVPWEEMRGTYGDTDIIRLARYSARRFSELFGEDVLRNVTWGDPFTEKDHVSNITPEELSDAEKSKRIGVVYYYDPAQKLFVVLMGGKAHVHSVLRDKEYPFVREDGQGFTPFLERLFYPPVSGHHGYGPLDLLFPIARLETAITNASALRAIESASPLRLIYTNDPEDAEKRYRQFEADRDAGVDRPMFLREEGVGTRMNAATLDYGHSNANFLEWQNFLQDQATKRVGIDFNFLTSESRTAFQQNLRKQSQQQTAYRVLDLNRYADIENALTDLWMLKKTESAFHNIVISIPEDVQQFFAGVGQVPEHLKRRVRDVMADAHDLELEVQPRLEGVLEGMDAVEVEMLKDMIGMEMPGTPAYAKLKQALYARVLPEQDLQEKDFLPFTDEEVAPFPFDGEEDEETYDMDMESLPPDEDDMQDTEEADVEVEDRQKPALQQEQNTPKKADKTQGASPDTAPQSSQKPAPKKRR